MEREQWEHLLFERRQADMFTLVLFFALLSLSFGLVKFFLASPQHLVTDVAGLVSVAASWAAFVLYVRAARRYRSKKQ